MSRQRLFTIFCGVNGLAFVLLGALVLAQQSAEWRSYGDWNAVSIGSVLDYFHILPSRLISLGTGFFDFPVSVVLFGFGILIAALSEGINLRRHNGARE